MNKRFTVMIMYPSGISLQVNTTFLFGQVTTIPTVAVDPILLLASNVVVDGFQSKNPTVKLPEGAAVTREHFKKLVTSVDKELQSKKNC